MEAERRRNTRSTAAAAAKRTPLSNLTNTPLIPDRSSAKNPPIPKPYHNFSLNSNNKPPPHLTPSKSDSSIGSSTTTPTTTNNVVLNPSNFRRHPQSLPLSPPPEPKTRDSSANRGSRDGVEPLGIYSRKQAAKRTKKSKGESAAAPYIDRSLDKTWGKGKEVSVSLSCTQVEKTGDKGKDILVPISAPSSVTTKDKGKGILVPSTTLSSVKTKDKRKFTAISFCTPQKNISTAQSCRPQRSSRTVRNEFPEAVDGLQRMLHTDPHPNKKKRLHSSQHYDAQKFALPEDFIQQQKAYFKEVDDFELVEEEVSCEEEEK